MGFNDSHDGKGPEVLIPTVNDAGYLMTGDEAIREYDRTGKHLGKFASVDDSIDEASADVTAVLKDGRRVHVFVEHAIGSLENPMTDAMLEGKFHDLSDPVLGAARTGELIKACWNLAQAGDVRALTALARP